MGCPGSVFVGDSLTFSIATHDVDTGVRTDASAAPTYNIYEDDTAAPVLTGTMTKHNSITGLYLKKVSTATLTGGKSYTVDISATVDSVTGGIAYNFRAEAPARLLLLNLAGLTGEASRSMLNAIRFLRNKWSTITGDLVVYKEDDTTQAWTAPLTTDANGLPITGVDPT
jgi:hypothetical protein